MTMHHLLRGRSPRRLRLLATAVLALPMVGCGAARSAGSSLAAGAVARLTSEDSLLFALERRLTDSAGVFLRREFAGAVLRPARRTWDGMRGDVRDDADSVTARVAAQLRDDLNESLQELLGDNLDILERRATHLARAMADTLTDALGRGLTTRLAAATHSRCGSLAPLH